MLNLRDTRANVWLSTCGTSRHRCYHVYVLVMDGRAGISNGRQWQFN
jgi:hypothetical protein